MELNKLREKSADELKAHLTDLHKEGFALRMQQVTGQLTKTHETRRVRREIARVNTLIGQAQASPADSGEKK
ncbi:50S ribosomal protein L29 [Lysobacter sp. A286]